MVLQSRYFLLLVAFILIQKHSFAYVVDSRTYGLNDKIEAAITGSDVVFWGELHGIVEQTDILGGFLDYSSEKNIFDTIATEYVWASMDPDFQNYLNDENAIAGSPSEAEFFKKISQINYIWTDAEEGRNIFRKFWKYRRNHPSVKMCGIDIKSARKMTYDERSSVWAMLPMSIQTLVNSVSGLPKLEILSSNYEYVREAGMASAVIECLRGSKKGLVITGSGHSTRESFYDPEGVNWKDMAAIVRATKSNVRTLSISNVIGPTGDDDDISPEFYEISNLIGLGAVSFLSNIELQDQLKRIHWQSKRKEFLLAWDFYILGSTGHHWNPVYRK